MNQAEFIKKFHAFLAESPPETAQIWCEFAGESVKRCRAHFRAEEKWNASSVADRLDALYDGLCQTRETYSSELSTKVAALGLERCCLYLGEMLRAAECLRAGDSAKEIQAKIESGEFECPDLFYASLSKNPSRRTCEMSNQEFIAHINTLIPAPNKEINGNLLDFGNSL